MQEITFSRLKGLFRNEKGSVKKQRSPYMLFNPNKKVFLKYFEELSDKINYGSEIFQKILRDYDEKGDSGKNRGGYKRL